MEKHPHVRGEDAYPHNKVSSYLETPPRAWGRPAVLNHAHLEGGNTPTCVGKTVRHADISLRVEKHPHVRGEDCIRLVPRGGRDRNTPTCVGKTVMGYPMSVAERKHPHVRGEDGRQRMAALCTEETPPRAWGRH